MKKIIILLIIFATCTNILDAQPVKRRNFFFGAGGGIGTFIGNEVMPDAKFNKLDYHLYAEFGRWVFPQFAVSTHFKAFTMHGQASYALNPLCTIETPGNAGRSEWINTAYASYENTFYYHYLEAKCISLDLRFTVDITNIIYDAVTGYNRKFHYFVALGFGEAVLFDQQRNAITANIGRIPPIGSKRHNWEVEMSLTGIVEYTINPRWTADLMLCFMTTRGTIDFSSYQFDRTVNLDYMPNVTIGLRYIIPQKAGGRAYCPQQTRRRKTWH